MIVTRLFAVTVSWITPRRREMSPVSEPMYFSGATTATFTVVNLAEYPDNAWGDTYTIVRVKIQTYAPAVA